VKYEFFLDGNKLPPGFKYPSGYIQFVMQEIPDFEPWRFFYDKDELEFFIKGLKQRYPKRIIVPFARRKDNDDVACFDASIPSDNPPVLIVHDFASEGWEGRGKLANFLAWVDLAKAESKEWKQFYEDRSNGKI
jgi:hypothetical protein